MKIDTGNDKIWIDSDNEEHKEIRIKKVKGNKIITINGEEVDEEVLEDMDVHIEEDAHIFISKGDKNAKNTVFIHAESDDEHDIQVITKKKNGFFFIDTDDDKEPLVIIDGKESTSKKMKRLDSDQIENINIFKGEKAIEKYGEKAKDGVIVITTKKN